MQDQVLFTSRPLLHIIIKPARKEMEFTCASAHATRPDMKVGFALSVIKTGLIRSRAITDVLNKAIPRPPCCNKDFVSKSAPCPKASSCSRHWFNLPLKRDNNAVAFASRITGRSKSRGGNIADWFGGLGGLGSSKPIAPWFELLAWPWHRTLDLLRVSSFRMSSSKLLVQVMEILCLQFSSFKWE